MQERLRHLLVLAKERGRAGIDAVRRLLQTVAARALPVGQRAWILAKQWGRSGIIAGTTLHRIMAIKAHHFRLRAAYRAKRWGHAALVFLRIVIAEAIRLGREAWRVCKQWGRSVWTFLRIAAAEGLRVSQNAWRVAKQWGHSGADAGLKSARAFAAESLRISRKARDLSKQWGHAGSVFLRMATAEVLRASQNAWRLAKQWGHSGADAGLKFARASAAVSLRISRKARDLSKQWGHAGSVFLRMTTAEVLRISREAWLASRHSGHLGYEFGLKQSHALAAASLRFGRKTQLLAKKWGLSAWAFVRIATAEALHISQETGRLAKQGSHTIFIAASTLLRIIAVEIRRLSLQATALAKKWGQDGLAQLRAAGAEARHLGLKAWRVAKQWSLAGWVALRIIAAKVFRLIQKAWRQVRHWGRSGWVIARIATAEVLRVGQEAWRAAKLWGQSRWVRLKATAAEDLRRGQAAWLLIKEYGRITSSHAVAIGRGCGDRLRQYALLMRLDKPIGILLLLWPALWALWIAAEGLPAFSILCIFVLGVVLMRSAGCVINDLADRDFDRHVQRTRDRPITSGRVAPREAATLTSILIFTAFILVLQLNPLTLKLSVIAVILAAVYPFMKRYTYLPQVFLGLAFGWSVPMAFAAQTDSVPEIAWLLLMTIILWAVVYDTMYAMVDREDDLRLGIKSTAILFEDADKLIIGIVQAMVLLALLMIGQRLALGVWYYTGLAVAALFSIYQQYLIRDRKPELCFRAFLNNNWFGAAVFAGIFLNYHFAN